MKLIDVHLHFDLDHVSDDEASTAVRAGVDYREEELLRDMDQAGVERALVLSTSVDGNASVRRFVEKHPDRFAAVATLHRSMDKKAALEGLEPDLSAGVYAGLKVYLGYASKGHAPVEVLGEEMRMLYEIAMANSLPVLFHTGDTLGSEAIVRYAHPLLLDEVAYHYPDLTIVMAHFGNPWLMDAAEVVYKNRNVHADLSGFFIGDQEPDHYLIDRLNSALAYCDAQKVMFGTDYPLIRHDVYRSFIEKLDLSEEKLEAVFYSNAAALFAWQ